jgi:CubicO group peptidase (beta-lactamase class C family)
LFFKLVNMRKYVITLIFFSVIIDGCIKDEDIKCGYDGFAPEQLNDGWEISTAEQEGLNTTLIESIYKNCYSEDNYPTLISLLIVRNNKLVAEAYFRGKADREIYHETMSATKSITSILFGIALDRDLISSVNTSINDFFPEYIGDNPLKKNITLKHLLTMQAGLEFNDNNSIELANHATNSVEYVLSREMTSNPGTKYVYNDGCPQVISGVIQKVSGITEEEFANQYLFGPLNIENYHWEKLKDNRTTAFAGLSLTARDMAKIGVLMLENGIWNGQQIVSSDWISTSTRKQVNTSDKYGYYWWLDLPDDLYYAAGSGGQHIYIDPENELVLVTIADPGGQELANGISSLIDDVLRAITK